MQLEIMRMYFVISHGEHKKIYRKWERRMGKKVV